MSDYLSQYKAELVDRYLQNQISNSEKDTLYKLLQRSNRTTVTERDIFAKLTLRVLRQTSVARENTLEPSENVNVKAEPNLPLDKNRTLKASENTQVVENRTLKASENMQRRKQPVRSCNKPHKTYYIHKETNTYKIKQTIQTIPN